MRPCTTGMSVVLNEKISTSPTSAGSEDRTWSIFSETCMRTMSSSWPQSNSRITIAPSASDVVVILRMPERVESTSSIGLVISRSTWRGLEFG